MHASVKQFDTVTEQHFFPLIKKKGEMEGRPE